MNKQLRKIFFVLSSLLFFIPVLSVNAQSKKERNLSEEIDVIRPYKPVLAESVKLKSNPEISDADTTTLDITYEMIDTRLELKDSIRTLPAEKMDNESLAKLYRSYIKLAGGNYKTAFGEIYINSLRNRNGQFGIYAGHHSSVGAVKNADFSTNALSLYGKRAFDASTLTGNASYRRNVNHFYGYNHSDTTIAKEAIQHKFDLLSAESELFSNLPVVDNKLNYSLRVKTYSLSDNFKTTEYNALPEGDFNIRMNKSTIATGIGFNLNQFTDSSFTGYNNVLFISPSFTYKDTLYRVTVGFNIASEVGSAESFHFYPNLSAEYLLSGNSLVVFAGLNGNLYMNTFRSFSETNPYLGSGLLIKNTNERSKLFGGFKGVLGRKTAYKAELSYKSIDNLALFINDSLDTKKLLLVYDGPKSKLTTFSLEAIHQQTEKLRLSFMAEYFQHDMTTESKAWHRPAIKLKFNSSYNIGNKFLIGLDVFHFGKSFAPDINTSGGVRTLKEITDANINIDYRYSKTFSIFLKFNNITGDKYERWMNYPGYGFNILAGLSLAL